MIILDGKAVAQSWKQEMRSMLADCKEQPCLAVISVGDDPASQVYIRNKRKACEEMGIKFEDCHFDEDYNLSDISRTIIFKLNVDKAINGIILQLPLARQRYCEDGMIAHITPEKDVDGLTAANQGRLAVGGCWNGFVPCTPLGICKLLDAYGLGNLSGKHAVIVGRSKLVGKPLMHMLLERNATVTVCHSQTQDLAAYTRQADILVVAVGKPGLITAEMVKPGAVVIDVGMNRVNGKLCGDVDFNGVKEVAGYITPVPGGVGPMTVAALMHNTICAALRQQRTV